MLSACDTRKINKRTQHKQPRTTRLDATSERLKLESTNLLGHVTTGTIYLPEPQPQGGIFHRQQALDAIPRLQALPRPSDVCCTASASIYDLNTRANRVYVPFVVSARQLAHDIIFKPQTGHT